MLKLNKKMNKLAAYTSASLVTGLMSSTSAKAADASFTTISQTITGQIGGLPGFITAISYIMGTLFAVLGILKIKDHVENPSNTPLKDGAIRLAVGGGLFVVPLITEAMQNLLGTGTGVDVQSMKNINTYNTVTP
ncbi:MAG: hypothetical protein A3J37_08440 [Alphaproteobacteria bacterium RIFCSPHIGHO2_12_FULL_45_9]|nr:MAG: hypothetical protein A3B66_04010 [Alphaproteobacteria bacterium RIFCSPHIGHO2_02_FULL_46_13]OFW97453.1 MAG: hypothetical protein A3J37_08440 [Alphaproteobacteria bacterium RIFCSPHIGHO2_12_FULL_45_9]